MMTQKITIARLKSLPSTKCMFCNFPDKLSSRRFSTMDNSVRIVNRGDDILNAGRISRSCSQALVADNVSKSASDQDTIESSQNGSNSTPALRFLEEVKTRTQLKGKLEKIKVKHVGHDKNMTIEVNRNYSTPLDVARHLGRNYSTLSACALANGSKVMDMNEPICEDKEISMEFVWFKNQFERNPELANKTLWNTCSVLSGTLLPQIFRDNIQVSPLMSTSDLTFTEGAFGYDFELIKTVENENDEIYWTANEAELNFINRKMKQLVYSKPSIYGMDVSLKTAEKILGPDSPKFSLVSTLFNQPSSSPHRVCSKVRLYLCGDWNVEVHPGPLLPSLTLIGQIQITAVYPTGQFGETGGSMHRIEGVGLPSVLYAHHWPWTVLTKAAKQDAVHRQTNMHKHDIESFAKWYKEEYALRK